MRWFAISGTAGRKELLVVVAAALAVLAAIGALHRSAGWWWLAPWAMPVAGLVLAALVATAIRRLHDLGRSGGWAALVLYPPAGALLCAALLVLRPHRHKHEASLAGAIFGGSLAALVGLAGVLALVWRPVTISEGAMKPTLLVGDVALVRQTGADSLARGDLVLVRGPDGGAERLLRLIGLPGDEISLQAGALYFGADPVPQAPAGTFSEIYRPQGPARELPRCRVEVGIGAACEAARLIETLPGGRRHAVLDLGTRAGLPDNFGPQTVPAGMLLLLGDNRDAAMDSRFAPAAGGLGLVPAGNVTGRADLLLFSSDGGFLAPWSWRARRILARIDRLEAP